MRRLLIAACLVLVGACRGATEPPMGDLVVLLDATCERPRHGYTHEVRLDGRSYGHYAFAIDTQYVFPAPAGPHRAQLVERGPDGERIWPEVAGTVPASGQWVARFGCD